MCLAIVKPGSVALPEEHLAQGWISNSDGGGFAYIEDGKVQFQKGFTKYQDFLTAYKATLAKVPDSPFLIHFRIASQGDKSADNTHPFPVPTGAMIHNGTLDGTGSVWGKGKSDTCLFAEKFGEALTHDVITEHKAKLDTAAGYNKIAFLYNDGKYAIINEGSGAWEKGVWYSNRSYVKYSAGPAYGTYARGMSSSVADCSKHGYPCMGAD